MSITPTKIYNFPLNLGNAVFNFGTHQLKVALTNTAPSVSTCNQYSDLTSPVSVAGFSGANPFNITTTSYTQTSGTASLILADLTLTANTTLAPFRYIVIYDDTATNKEIICFTDYGSSYLMGSGDTFVIDFDNTNGILQIVWQ